MSIRIYNINYLFSVISLIAVLFLSSCIGSSKKTKEPNQLDFGSFTIETPPTWQKIESKGVDSYVGGIKLDSTDRVGFDFGLYSNDLEEFIRLDSDDSSAWYSTTEKHPKPILNSNDLKRLRKSAVNYDTIDNYLAKIVKPIQPGNGTIGVYFDSLWSAGAGRIKLQISGTNLNPENEVRFLKAIHTLKFHNLKE